MPVALLPFRRSLLLAVAAAPWAALAQEGQVHIEGASFDRRARVAGSELVLNGVGVRAVAWFTGYAAGLYLPTRVSSAAQAVALEGPKRLQMRMLYEVPAAEFVKAFRKGVQRNVSAAELPRLVARMDRFAALIAGLGKVKKGDVVNLDFEPGRGTLFSLNGTLRGEPIEGSEFYAALLRSFVGERPYDEKLRAGLLGHGA
ncbi:MAG TPA: chalcone isomerase family protein [Rubrivivax sp.]|nr:chalcone isomerase family protein [Rubrivivax sp.]